MLDPKTMQSGRYRLKAVLEQSAVLQATCNRLTEERDAARDVGDAFGRAGPPRSSATGCSLRTGDCTGRWRMLQRALDRKKSP